VPDGWFSATVAALSAMSVGGLIDVGYGDREDLLEEQAAGIRCSERGCCKLLVTSKSKTAFVRS
jgi:hypothetical protein